MDPHCVPLHTIAELYRRLFLSCLDGLTDTQAGERLSNSTSSLLFLLAHLLDARAYLVTLAGGELSHPLVGQLRSVAQVEDISIVPCLEDFRSGWESVSVALLSRLPALEANDLGRASTDRMPVLDQTVLGALTFLLQHESYHLGQLAMLKKHLTGKAMKYTWKATP
jgi:uncharacterized damage-inducible protein DinB